MVEPSADLPTDDSHPEGGPAELISPTDNMPTKRSGGDGDMWIRQECPEESNENQPQHAVTVEDVVETGSNHDNKDNGQGEESDAKLQNAPVNDSTSPVNQMADGAGALTVSEAAKAGAGTADKPSSHVRPSSEEPQHQAAQPQSQTGDLRDTHGRDDRSKPEEPVEASLQEQHHSDSGSGPSTPKSVSRTFSNTPPTSPGYWRPVDLGELKEDEKPPQPIVESRAKLLRVQMEEEEKQSLQTMEGAKEMYLSESSTGGASNAATFTYGWALTKSVCWSDIKKGIKLLARLVLNTLNTEFREEDILFFIASGALKIGAYDEAEALCTRIIRSTQPSTDKDREGRKSNVNAMWEQAHALLHICQTDKAKPPVERPGKRLRYAELCERPWSMVRFRLLEESKYLYMGEDTYVRLTTDYSDRRTFFIHTAQGGLRSSGEDRVDKFKSVSRGTNCLMWGPLWSLHLSCWDSPGERIGLWEQFRLEAENPLDECCEVLLIYNLSTGKYLQLDLEDEEGRITVVKNRQEATRFLIDLVVENGRSSSASSDTPSRERPTSVSSSPGNLTDPDSPFFLISSLLTGGAESNLTLP